MIHVSCIMMNHWWWYNMNLNFEIVNGTQWQPFDDVVTVLHLAKGWIQHVVRNRMNELSCMMHMVNQYDVDNDNLMPMMRWMVMLCYNITYVAYLHVQLSCDAVCCIVSFGWRPEMDHCYERSYEAHDWINFNIIINMMHDQTTERKKESNISYIIMYMCLMHQMICFNLWFNNGNIMKVITTQFEMCSIPILWCIDCTLQIS